MTTKKTKIYRLGLLAIVCFCLTFLATMFLCDTRVASAAENEAKKVYVGDEIQASEYTLSYGGKEVKAEGLTAVYPSGGIFGGEVLLVEQAGAYEITYYATVDGNRVEETQSYMAVRLPQDVIYSTDGATVAYGKYEVESPYQMKKETYGALATFKAGTSIVFSTTIPTAKLTADYNLIDFIVMPSVFGETDFERVTLCITDANDPTNYVEVVIDSSNAVDGDGQVTYVRAGANGQQIGGYEGSKYHTVNYGTQVEHSFRATARAGEFRHNVTISEHSLTVALDNASKKIYCGPASYDDANNLLVNDLDDTANYKGNPWGGFTSDEVTVKLVASAFTKSTAKIVIKSFGDYNYASDIVDTEKPQIKLNYANDSYPIATVGEEFPIIPFTAKDALDSQLKTGVYVYYLAPNGQKINVSHNGTSFLAKYEGNYQIVYFAEDYSGNRTEKEISIAAYAKTPQIIIGVDENVETDVYQTVAIKQAADVKVFGGHGDLRIERTVYSPKGEILDVESELLLTELGDYKVVYKVTDYLQQVEYGVVTISSKAVKAPSFINVPDFDKVLIKGFSYKLPQPFVVEVVDGKVVQVPCKVKVNDKAVDGRFVADGSAAEIVYIAEGATGTTTYTISRSVVDTEEGKYQDRYFITDGADIVYEKKYLQFVFEDDASLEFIKEIYSEKFEFAFSYNSDALNISTMSVILSNAANRNLKVTFYFIYDAESNAWMMQINGKGHKVDFSISDNYFYFTLSVDTFNVLDGSGAPIATIREYDNGEAFNGFGGMLYFGMEFGGVYETSSIEFTKLCNQVLGYAKNNPDNAKDEFKPVIHLSEEFVRRQKLGSEAKIPTAIANDVLGQIVEFTVTVKKKDGTVLATGDATVPVKMIFSEPGTYLVVYYAKDSNRKSVSLEEMINVYDETAPTLTVNGSLNATYKVGDKVSIPEYSAVDNSENCEIQVMLILPNNEVRLLHYVKNGDVTSLLEASNNLYNSSFKADSKTFVLEQKGMYVLRFIAYDEYYNCVEKEIVFNVK